MAAMQLADFRKLVSERIAAWNKNYYENEQAGNPGYSAPPPQLIEAMVNLETGGTFDPEFVDPLSGAIGLGQITTGGLEWGWYKSTHPTAKESDLKDPKVNLDVMIDGLSRRQFMGEWGDGSPGAYEDWYLAAGGYLGGLGNDYSEQGADAYGTTWRDYVRRVRTYIVDTFGEQSAKDIDDLESQSAVAAGDDWLTGEISIDKTTKSAQDRRGIFNRLEATFNAAVGKVGDTLGDIAGQVLGGLLGYVGAAAPRVGLALGGLALFVVGVLVIVRPSSG